MTEGIQLVLICGSFLSIPLIHALIRKRFDVLLLVLASYSLLLGALRLWSIQNELNAIAAMREGGFYNGPTPSLILNVGWPLILIGLAHLFAQRRITGALLFAGIAFLPV